MQGFLFSFLKQEKILDDNKSESLLALRQRGSETDQVPIADSVNLTDVNTEIFDYPH